MKFIAALPFAFLLSASAFAQDDETLLNEKIEQALEKFRRGRFLREIPKGGPEEPLLPASRQTQDDERVKRIVDRIEKEIRDSHDRTREEIRAIILAEIRKGQTPAPQPTPQASPRKVYLGISAEDMTDAERKALGVGGGIKVADVRGPAKDAGIKAADILVELDGEAVTEERIGELLAKHKPGDTVEATVLRSKKRVTVKVVLAERKD
ncbi:MAG: PDZ domain-containing protein [Vicinamibacteria bacterium]